MTRPFRDIGRLGLTIGTTSMLFSSCSVNDELPNILWITIEDTSPQFVGFYGNSQVKTPNIDRLARQGVIFTNAFSTAPVSAPSRFTLITGINPGQAGTGNMRSNYPIPAEIKGFPSYLRNIGYYTTNNSKTDYNIREEKKFVTDAWNESGSSAGWWKRNTGQPFFSVFNFMESHQSYTMTNTWDWYEKNVLGNLPEENQTHPEEIDMPPIYRDSKDMRKYISRVYNSINLTDIRVGKLVDSLKRNGLMESTIIFFFGDNGEGIPRGKSSSIGLSYHVPFFIWFPDKYKHLSPWKTGQTIDELICFEDIPPTMLSLLGADIPSYMTGRPFLGNKRNEPVSYVFGMRDRIGDSPDLVRTAADGRFFYMRVFYPRYPNLKWQKYADESDIVQQIKKDHREGKLNSDQSLMLQSRGVECLYDLKNDPWELHNLAGDPQWKSKLSEMRKATYERTLWNKDILFLPEYEIDRISFSGTAYEYRNSAIFNSKRIIDAAYEATDPVTKPERLFVMLNDENAFIRYWAAVGIHNNLAGEKIDRERLSAAMKDKYPPVVIESAAAAWDNFNDPVAKELIKQYVMDKNPYLSLHALQMIQYMNQVPEDLLTVVQLLFDALKNPADVNKIEYSVSNCCEVILYRFKGRPLK